MIKVSPRAHTREDRAGDPLDGLVNLFDVGIVLAVAFLLAALSSLNLTSALTKSGLQKPAPNTITVPPNQTAKPVPSSAARTAGEGTPIGRVYRLRDGRLIYVVPTSAVPSSGPSSVSSSPQPSAPSTP